MRNSMAWIVSVVLAFSIACSWSASWAAGKFVTIGTGGVTGVYYPTGNAISKMMNNKRSTYGYKVTAEATGASVFNINALGVGDMDLGLCQSDKAAQAWDGKEEWKDKGPQRSLRGICTLNSETVSLIASVKSGILTCADLKGKVVAVGNPGSGTRQNSLDAMSTCGLTFESLAKAEGVKASEAASLLQDGRIDAYFYTVGHPNGSLKEAAAGGTEVRFVPFSNVKELIEKNPYYSRAVIPIAMYQGFKNTEDIPTFGVKACLITTDKAADDLVYAITKELFTNLDQLRTLHPALADLQRDEMVKGLPVPFHPGAIRYFREIGLDKLLPKE